MCTREWLEKEIEDARQRVDGAMALLDEEDPIVNQEKLAVFLDHWARRLAKLRKELEELPK